MRQYLGRFCVFSEMENVLRNKLGGTMAFMCAQSLPQIPRSLPRCSFAFARHKNEIPNTPEKSLFWGSNSRNNPSFFKEIYFFGEPRLPIVLLHLGPATNRISAILVVQVPNGTHMQRPSELSFGTEVVYRYTPEQVLHMRLHIAIYLHGP